MASDLEKAIKDGVARIPDSKVRSALSQVTKRLTSLQRRSSKSKAHVSEASSKVVCSAEVQGTLFLSSLAEGYFGEDRLKVGGVDLRAPTALLAQGYGLYETFNGNGGSHSLAIGNGLMGSWLATVARNAGGRLRTRATVAGTDPMTPTAPRPFQGLPEPQDVLPQVQLTPTAEPLDLAGPVREITLSPEPTPQKRHKGRFVRARSD